MKSHFLINNFPCLFCGRKKFFTVQGTQAILYYNKKVNSIFWQLGITNCLWNPVCCLFYQAYSIRYVILQDKVFNYKIFKCEQIQFLTYTARHTSKYNYLLEIRIHLKKVSFYFLSKHYSLNSNVCLMRAFVRFFCWFWHFFMLTCLLTQMEKYL